MDDGLNFDEIVKEELSTKMWVGIKLMLFFLLLTNGR
jgi:hypothetical protein